MKAFELHSTWKRFDTPRWRRALGAGCVAVLCYALVRQLTHEGFALATSDLSTYYSAALAVRHGANPFTPVATWIAGYQPGQNLIATHYVYAPAFAVLLIPLTYLPLTAAFVVWDLCNVAFLPATIYCLARAAGVHMRALEILAVAAACSLLSTVRIELSWGQSDIFLLFLIAAALAARQSSRPGFAGVLLAVACVTKPPLLLFVGFLLWKRELRFAVTTVASFLVLLLAPFLWLGGQALRDQIAIWRFWSDQYLPFIDNQSPKGVLARLFTVNPYVRPLFVEPLLVTLGWLALAALLAILLLAVTRPVPLGADTRSLMEVGGATSVLLLVSPLTEYIYVTLAVLPLVALYMLLRESRWRQRPYREIAIALAVIWFVLCFPLEHIEHTLWSKMATSSPVADLYVVLSPTYVYMVGVLFVVQIWALCAVAHTSLWAALRELGALTRVRTQHALEAAHMAIGSFLLVVLGSGGSHKA
jgi:hypothetical protein